MATPMITRRGGYPARYAKPVASARLVAFRRKRPIDGRTADEQYELALLHPQINWSIARFVTGTCPTRMTGVGNNGGHPARGGNLGSRDVRSRWRAKANAAGTAGFRGTKHVGSVVRTAAR
jgi:hypothetical protein